MAKRTVQTPPKSFEDAIAELEQILADIEGGELGLEESLTKYERGNLLIQYCRGVLNSAEKQIDLLSKVPDGGLAATPMRLAPAADEPDDLGDDEPQALGEQDISEDSAADERR
jgi:exodeoxyribonuclease VII small subunit